MRTSFFLLFSLVLGMSFYACKEETEDISDLSGTFQLKIKEQPLHLNFYEAVYSETSSKHKIVLEGDFISYNLQGVALSTEFELELTEAIGPFNEELEDGILQVAAYTANGISSFEQKTRLKSEVVSDPASWKTFEEGAVFLTGMDAEKQTLSGYFNLVVEDTILLKGNFFEVDYIID